MRRPGYLAGYRSNRSRPGNLGNDLDARDAVYFMQGSAMPPEIETGYIPEYLIDAGALPYGMEQHIQGFNPRPLTTGVPSISPDNPFFYQQARFPRPRDPRTFNVLMI